jgi:hypothetical protein
MVRSIPDTSVRAILSSCNKEVQSSRGLRSARVFLSHFRLWSLAALLHTVHQDPGFVQVLALPSSSQHIICTMEAESAATSRLHMVRRRKEGDRSVILWPESFTTHTHWKKCGHTAILA